MIDSVRESCYKVLLYHSNLKEPKAERFSALGVHTDYYTITRMRMFDFTCSKYTRAREHWNLSLSSYNYRRSIDT